jgi:hypothetical protein
MLISEEDFQYGHEIDYHMSHIETYPILGEVIGRISLRKTALSFYQFYLRAHTIQGVNTGTRIPAFEIVLYETTSLKDAVKWGNKTFQNDRDFPDEYDGYEDCIFLGKDDAGRPGCIAQEGTRIYSRCRFCPCTQGVPA